MARARFMDALATVGISPKTLVKDRVYERLLLDIVCRDIIPGSHLDESDLVDRYGAGRYGIREALQRLSIEGLVVRRPRVGTTVKDLSVIDLHQVFECRVLIESHCAALAAQRASMRQIEWIALAFDGVDDVLGRRDWRALVQMDQAFHRSLAEATDNQHLFSAVTVLHNNSLRFWHYALPRRSAGYLRWEVDQHLSVVSALEARDPVAAQQAMRGVLGAFPKDMEGLLHSVLE